MSELNLKEVEKRFVAERPKRALARGAWVSLRGEEREAVLEAYGLYRCELAAQRLLEHVNAFLEAVAVAARAAGGTAAEARRRVGAPVPAGAPKLKGAEEVGSVEELAERMAAVYASAKTAMPELVKRARAAAVELAALGCIPEDLARAVRRVLAVAGEKQEPKYNYRWWLPETAHAALLAAESAHTAWTVWRVKAKRLEEKVATAKGSPLVAEALLRYENAKSGSGKAVERLSDLMRRIEPARKG